MINKSSLSIAMGAVDPLINKGLTVVAGSNTIIAELTRLSQPALPINLTDVAEDKRVEVFIGSFGEDYHDQHSATQDQLVTELRDLTQKHISFAKNVVKPLVMHFAEDVQKFVQDYRAVDPAANFEIVTLAFPEVIDDESFVDSIKHYKGRTSLAPEKLLTLPKVDDGILSAMFVTGAKRVDKLIQEWLGNKDADFIQKVWTDFFSTDSYAAAFDRVLSSNNFHSADEALAVYLIALHLSTNVAENTGMSLPQYNKIVEQYLMFAGSVLHRRSDLNKVYNGLAKTLVITRDRINKRIYVNAPVYKEWIATGGKNEYLLGVLVSDIDASTVASINTVTDKLKEAWNRYYLFAKHSSVDKSFEDFKQMLNLNFIEEIRNLSDEEKAYAEKNSSHTATAIKLSSEIIDSLTPQDMNDPFGIALKLVGKARFYYTSAYEILNDINQAALIDPNVDVREAALIAAINYLSAYMAGMLAVKQ